MTPDSAAIEALVQRRMVVTGESYDEARRHVVEVSEKLDAERLAAPPGWEKEWLTLPAPDEEQTEEIRQFLAGMSPECQAVAVQFPPACLVRANRPLHTPAPGTVGLIMSYRERADGRITVTVLPHPEATVPGECEPEWLEVVHYRNGITPEYITGVLRGLMS